MDSTNSQSAPGRSSNAVGSITSDFSAALYTFLDRLSPSMVGRLYESPASCLSIFRLLPETARHVVLNMLWYYEPLTVSILSLWVRERRSEGGSILDRKHLKATLSSLARLHILTEQKPGPGGVRSDQSANLLMHPKFRENFKRALTGGGTQGSFGVALNLEDDDPEPKVDVFKLDAYAEQQWEITQHFMVGSSISASTRPSPRILDALVRGGLMTSSTRNTNNLTITSKGFQFLLEDINTQLWDLLLQYLEASEDVVQVLGFLFMLGSLELGRCYSTENHTLAEQRLLEDLMEYGLIYQSKPNSKAFWPTRLATTLTSSAAPLVSSQHADEERGFLIVETNYKVYAYTSNPLQIAVLNLFVSLKSRFPNFVSGVITRDSIKRGLEKGITADQIISYLTTRAHPQMRKTMSAKELKFLLPPTVVDQIRLWELEKRRIVTEDGYLYDGFTAPSDYKLVVNYAQELGVVTWNSPETRKFFVTAEGHPQVRDFIKRRIAAAA